MRWGGSSRRGTQGTHGSGLAMVRRLMEGPARKLRRAKLLVAEAAASDAAEANVGVCCKNCGAAALDSVELVDASTQWDIDDAATAEQMGCSDYIAQPLPKQKMSKHKMPKPPQCAPPKHMVMKLQEKALPSIPPLRGSCSCKGNAAATEGQGQGCKTTIDSATLGSQQQQQQQ